MEQSIAQKKTEHLDEVETKIRPAIFGGGIERGGGGGWCCIMRPICGLQSHSEAKKVRQRRTVGGRGRLRGNGMLRRA